MRCAERPRQEEGRISDIVVGVVETHGRKETEALLASEVVRAGGLVQGPSLEEMDS
jgi:K+-sensing histidine kinase KdpD